MKSRTCFISITTLLRPAYPFMGVLILRTCHHDSLTKKITLQFSYICSRTSHLFFWAIFRSSWVISLSTSNELNPGDTLLLHPAPPPQNIDMKTSFQFLSHKNGVMWIAAIIHITPFHDAQSRGWVLPAQNFMAETTLLAPRHCQSHPSPTSTQPQEHTRE